MFARTAAIGLCGIAAATMVCGTAQAAPQTGNGAPALPVIVAADIPQGSCADVTNGNQAASETGAIKSGSTSTQADYTNCIYTKYINPFVRFLAAAVALLALIRAIMAAIQYSSSGGDPGKTSQAKKSFAQAIFAIFCFIFLLGVLRWLLPGGLSGTGL